LTRKKEYTRRVREQAGQPPGTPLFIGKRRMEQVRISYMRYNESLHEEKEISSPRECAELCRSNDVVWINVEGIHDESVVEELGGLFGIHPLTMEDIVNTLQRPKFEDFGAYIYIILKMLYYSQDQRIMETEQVSVILGENFVITFQERPGDVFDPVRERIRDGRGRIRKAGPDYLAYALADAVVDSYFLILESIGDQIEDVEDRVVLEPEPETVADIHRFKRAMLFMRRTVWPLREEIALLEKSGSKLVDDSTSVFLRNLYDHTIQVIDTIETYRDIISGMHDTYLSSVSNRMNEVMKVLTIIATIFIPLTFIAGIYGMNFRHMPELKWEFGYFATLGIMVIVALVMVLYFKRKKWI
jgi:magnesium transporter